MKKLLIIGCIVVALFTGYIIFARNSHAAPRNDEFDKIFDELKKSDQRPGEPTYPPKIVDEVKIVARNGWTFTKSFYTIPTMKQPTL